MGIRTVRILFVVLLLTISNGGEVFAQTKPLVPSIEKLIPSLGFNPTNSGTANLQSAFFSVGLNRLFEETVNRYPSDAWVVLSLQRYFQGRRDSGKTLPPKTIVLIRIEGRNSEIPEVSERDLRDCAICWYASFFANSNDVRIARVTKDSNPEMTVLFIYPTATTVESSEILAIEP
jgi:hypothetical protein